MEDSSLTLWGCNTHTHTHTHTQIRMCKFTCTHTHNHTPSLSLNPYSKSCHQNTSVATHCVSLCFKLCWSATHVLCVCVCVFVCLKAECNQRCWLSVQRRHTSCDRGWWNVKNLGGFLPNCGVFFYPLIIMQMLHHYWSCIEFRYNLSHLTSVHNMFRSVGLYWSPVCCSLTL